MLAIIILFIAAVGDRLTKMAALKDPHRTISILWRIFWFEPYANTTGPLYLPLSPTIALVLAIAIGVFAGFLFLRAPSTLQRVAFGLIALGVLSNAYDRYVYGYVIDVFRVVNSLSFNVADVFIVLGIALILPSLILT